MDATQKAGHEVTPAARPGQHDTPVELVVPEPDALLRSFSACVAAHEELRRSHAELQRRMSEFADEFGAVRSALRREQLDKARLEEEVRRLREGPAEPAELAARLREKELLLREMHHRVNNNLQIIISLFHLQTQHVADPAARALFQESQNRVHAMALIHERLYRARDLGRVDFGDYVRGLTAHVFRSFGVTPSRVRLEVEAPTVAFNIETMIPCGLILNELVSNALKYAFPGERSGLVSIRLSPQGDQCYELRVADDGVGLPPGVDVQHTESLGLQIVTALAEQLEGAVSVSGPPGTLVAVIFHEQATKSGRPS